MRRINPRATPDLDAEYRVCAALLHHCGPGLGGEAGEVLDRIAPHVSAEDFRDGDTAQTFAIVEALIRDGHPVDIGTVADRLVTQYGWGSEEAEEWGHALANHIATTVNVEHQARIIRGYANGRALAALCQATLEQLRGLPWDETGAVLDRHIGDVMALADRRSNTGRLVSLNQATRELMAEVQAKYETPADQRRDVTGCRTGSVAVDKRLKGLRPGHQYIVGARPGMGKTAIGIAWAMGAASEGVFSVLYISLEIPTRDIAVRANGSLSGVNTERIESGELKGRGSDVDEVSLLQGGVFRLKGFGENLQILDQPGASLAQVRQSIRRMKRRKDIPPLGAVFVDYLQLMKPPHRYPGGREREVGELSAGLLAIAKTEQVAVVSLAQLNRQCETRGDKRPMMADVRESGTIEQDASVVMLLYRDDVYNKKSERPNQIEVIIAKNRLGRTGTAYVHYDRTCQRIADLELRYGRDDDDA